MSDYENEEIEAIQGVVDRVNAYQDTAEEWTAHEELRKGFDEIGVEVSPAHVDTLASAIAEDSGDVSAAELING